MTSNNRIAFQYFVLAFVCLTVTILSCNRSSGKGGEKPQAHKQDTSMVFFISVTPDLKNVWNGVGRRVIVYDTTQWNQKDSVTIKKERGIDSFYSITQPSWQDTATRLIYLDSVQGRVRVVAWWDIPKIYVRSGWNDAQADMKYLEGIVKRKK